MRKILTYLLLTGFLFQFFCSTAQNRIQGVVFDKGISQKKGNTGNRLPVNKKSALKKQHIFSNIENIFENILILYFILFILGVIFTCSIGASIAATQAATEVTRICWKNSCGQLSCGLYYPDETFSVLKEDMENSEKDCQK